MLKQKLTNDDGNDVENEEQEQTIGKRKGKKKMDSTRGCFVTREKQEGR